MSANSSITNNEWLQAATQRLNAAGISTARLDALVLLEDITGQDRAHLLAHPETVLSTEHVTRLNNVLTERATHLPLAYVRGKTEFYGREFRLTHDVLEPRPESETMIDLLKQLPLVQSSYIADVGSGSGALGITAALELKNVPVDLLELDQKALQVSRLNNEILGARTTCLQSDLLTAVPDDSYTIILANLPYVPDDYQINTAAMMEPRLAIFGGADGLDLYRRLFRQIAGRQNRIDFVLTESLPFQHDELRTIARTSNFIQRQAEDFIQVFTRKK